MEYLLGVDMGTLGTKAVLFDLLGNMVTSSYFPHREPYTPNPAISEQDADDWWRAVQLSVKEVFKRGISPQEIVGIGLSTQGGGLVCVDEGGKTLIPVMTYADRRTMAERVELQELLNKKIPEVMKGRGTPNSLAQILWVRKHQPAVEKAAVKFMTSRGYLGYKLTDVVAFDDYGSRGFGGDFDSMKWIPDILDVAGVSEEKLGKIYRSWEIFGNVSKTAEEETGLKEGTPVCTGVWDGMCNIVGSGLTRQGMVMDITGTTEICTVLAKGPGKTWYKDAGPYLPPLGKGLYYWYSSPRPTGNILHWFKEFASGETEASDKLGLSVYQLMDLEAEKVGAGSNRLIVFPHFQGVTYGGCTPDYNTRGFFIGVTLAHRRGHFIRAIMESVAYTLRHIFDVYEEDGASLDEVRVSGGGAKSELWNQIKADVTGRRMALIHCVETSALGAVMLASVGLKVHKDFEDAANNMVRIAKRYEPNKVNYERYNKLYEVYWEAYNQLKGPFAKLAAIQ
ncbi:MAG: xylulokinase [Thermoproteota archaeon]|nr:xylulokinase [Thermoproteota archaeon]